MAFKIFYSWQLKRDKAYNKNFIENCLVAAIKKIRKDLEVGKDYFIIDKDTKNEPGMPFIPVTIEEKIKGADLFIGDLTYNLLNEEEGEGVPNSNVLTELGLALGILKEGRIVTVMNELYGPAEILPFDLKQRKYPVVYNYKGEESEKEPNKTSLINQLYDRIKTIFETELERQKQEFYPFQTWKYWDSTYERPFQFEPTEKNTVVLSEIRQNIETPKAVYRLCGLSGIGKTRLLFECFLHNGEDVKPTLTNKVLYCDLNITDIKVVLHTIKTLLNQNENKVLILDNCPKDIHNNYITPLIIKANSNLSTITVSSDPEETINQLDENRLTRLITLNNEDFKPIVSKILSNNFNELDEREKDLLVDFSSGIPFVATLMVKNTDRGKYQPGSLTRDDVVSRLLGPIYNDADSKSVISACSLFSWFGFSDELSPQADAIALCEDICAINIDHVHPDDIIEYKKKKFRQVCQLLLERQLLEKKGRTCVFRPSPLAIRMAEDWWRNCTLSRFQRIIVVLRDNNLVEGFCEQFKFLKHVENARIIVKDLCDSFFNSAEVLNTTVGSRLFRSFVYVNPRECSRALSEAFSNLQNTDIKRVKEGRRNLIWALEQLCFRPETFSESAKVMIKMALGENENLGNNATHQFLQLFHIYLPGTATNLEERLKVVTELINQKDEDAISLGLHAINSGLAVGNFHRMGGAERQGDTHPLSDYNPSPKEIYEYWRELITLLQNVAFTRNHFQIVAVKILMDSFYGLCSKGAGSLILPVIIQLLDKNLITRLDLRQKAQFILRSEKIFDPTLLAQLEEIFNSLTLESLSDKLQVYIKQPSSIDYYDENKSRKTLEKNVEDAAKHFISEKSNWPIYSSYLTAGPITEGFNFGALISDRLSDIEITELLSVLLGKLKQIPNTEKNISVILGLLSRSSKEIVKQVFQEVLKDPDFYFVAFAIARTMQLPYHEISLLIQEAKKGKIGVNLFLDFSYGWGIKHLEYQQVLHFLNEIKQLNEDGIIVAFTIMASWSYNDSEAWELIKQSIREIVLNDSTLLFGNLKRFDIHLYETVATKLLSETNDTMVAELLTKLILNESSEWESFHSKENTFYRILEILQEKHFPILWDQLSKYFLDVKNKGIAILNLKDLLGAKSEYYSNTEGLLFKGDSQKFETIFQWCKEHQGDALHWVAQILPYRDINLPNAWHPYAKLFLDEFGNNKDVLSAIGASIGTFGWVGSIVPKLDADKALFEQLLSHPIVTVKEWAEMHITDLNNRIQFETNRDEEYMIGL